MGGNVYTLLPSGKLAVTYAFGRGGWKSSSYEEGVLTDSDSTWLAPGAYTPNAAMGAAMLSKPSTVPQSGVVGTPVTTWREPTQYPVTVPTAPAASEETKTNLEQVAEVIAEEAAETIPIITDPESSALRSDMVKEEWVGVTKTSGAESRGFSKKNEYSINPHSQRMTSPKRGGRRPLRPAI